MSNRAATGRVSPACVGDGSTLPSAGGGTKKTSCGDKRGERVARFLQGRERLRHAAQDRDALEERRVGSLLREVEVEVDRPLEERPDDPDEKEVLSDPLPHEVAEAPGEELGVPEADRVEIAEEDAPLLVEGGLLGRRTKLERDPDEAAAERVVQLRERASLAVARVPGRERGVDEPVRPDELLRRARGRLHHGLDTRSGDETSPLLRRRGAAQRLERADDDRERRAFPPGGPAHREDEAPQGLRQRRRKRHRHLFEALLLLHERRHARVEALGEAAVDDADEGDAEGVDVLRQDHPPALFRVLRGRLDEVLGRHVRERAVERVREPVLEELLVDGRDDVEVDEVDAEPHVAPGPALVDAEVLRLHVPVDEAVPREVEETSSPVPGEVEETRRR